MLAQPPTLIADIGGTNARFALVGPGGAALGNPVAVAVANYRDFETALRDAVLPALEQRPRSAALAVAAVIDGDRAHLTNGTWTIEPRRLVLAHGLDQVCLLNDFEALALSVPHLRDEMLLPIGGGICLSGAPKLVIGAGTGLGVAALVSVEGRWLPMATEAGHVDFGPTDRRDFEIWPHLLRSGGDRISAEMLLSGSGIERLYVAVARSGGAVDRSLSAPEIVDRAAARSDPAAAEAVDLFCGYLGRFAGSMALVFLARGGVYIGGGIAPRIAERLESGGFRTAFEDKHPFAAFVASIGTSLITHPEPALLGLARLVADPSRYLIDLAKRTWHKE
jgi:glucokinase